MPYEPFLLGVGVVFNLLTWGLSGRGHCSPSAPAEARRWIFFDFGEGIFAGHLAHIFREFCFRSHTVKAQKYRGKFRSIFREKIRASKKIFRADFVLQTCHPKSLQKISVKFPRNFRRISTLFPGALHRMCANFRTFSAEFPQSVPQTPLPR